MVAMLYFFFQCINQILSLYINFLLYLVAPSGFQEEKFIKRDTEDWEE
jgi:hypothetical protein